MVIFLYNLYIFVWIQHGCIANTIYALDPNNSVIKRLWCTCFPDLAEEFPKDSKKVQTSHSKRAIVVRDLSFTVFGMTLMGIEPTTS